MSSGYRYECSNCENPISITEAVRCESCFGSGVVAPYFGNCCRVNHTKEHEIKGQHNIEYKSAIAIEDESSDLIEKRGTSESEIPDYIQKMIEVSYNRWKQCLSK